MKGGGILFVTFLLLQLVTVLEGSWDQWWTYNGISGPQFWGLLNMNWSMCEKGRRQSPINIEPDKLVYDPHLRHLHIDKHRISGRLHNMGQSVIFRVDPSDRHSANITGGPLVYRYRFEELYIHFGETDETGSEHQINGKNFPGEIQLYGFNADLYGNMSEAQQGSNGIVGISIMIQVGSHGNDEFRILSSGFSKVIYREDNASINHISLAGLLPSTQHYMTYDGSTTHPGCWETTTWLIMNKPLYITRRELDSLRQLYQGDRTLRKTKMANNFRPVKPLHHRTVRTNIDFTNAFRNKDCPSMHREMFYEGPSVRSPCDSLANPSHCGLYDFYPFTVEQKHGFVQLDSVKCNSETIHIQQNKSDNIHAKGLRVYKDNYRVN